MPKESDEIAYRTYCQDRLVVSESATEVHADNSVKDIEDAKLKKVKKPSMLIMK